MTRPAGEQIITLKDGRQLAFAEYGDAQGRAVFYCNASGGSRLARPGVPSLLTDLRIRLISTERPGHGLSDPQPGRRLLDWPDDVRQIADHLGIERFFVMGWSAGGPHTLACAYKLPNRVRAAATVSGVAPPERPKPYQGLPFPNRMLMLFARRMPRLVFALRRQVLPLLQGDVDAVGKRLAASFPSLDCEILMQGDNLEMFVADIREGYRQGADGPAQDDIIINTSWGFRLEDIQTRVDVWQGELDRNVPANQGRYLDLRLPNSRLVMLEEQAHGYLLTHWAQILEMLTAL